MDVFNYISNNGLVSGFIILVISVLGSFIWRFYKDRRDSNKIYDFMRTSSSVTEFRFRTTEAISSKTKILESRVAELCSRHPKIRRNEKSKQSWQLVD